MTRIKRISRLRNCGIFRDFRWPDDLLDFARYNLIYGWNWTGKTTLSRILRCLEKRVTPEGEVVIIFDDNREIRTENFPEEFVPIKVFNKDFISENVFPVDGGDLPPIFVLGEKSVEKQKELEIKKEELKRLQSELNSIKEDKKKAERDLDRFCIDRARVIKDTLRSSGANPYNNYNKTDYRLVAEKMIKNGDAEKYILSENEYKKLLARHRATPKPKIQEINYDFPDLESITRNVSAMLRSTVISRTIENLKHDPSLAEWLRQGLSLHQQRQSQRCLFCEQPLPKDRLKVLEEHFSEHYRQFIQKIEDTISGLKKEVEKIENLSLPNEAQFYDDLAEKYRKIKNETNVILKKTKYFLEKAVERLEEKKNKPFERMDLNLSLPVQNTQVIDEINTIIQEHNQVCADFQEMVHHARRVLARAMIAETLKEFIKLKGNLGKATAREKDIQERLSRIHNEILKLEKQIIEHRRPAEELNEDLHKYLGHNELKLEVKHTGYAITRGGVPAQNLSEGEMKAVALLYFLKSLEDKNLDLKNTIIVLDDPVSSLDENALYLAFGFIRERTKDSGQLIILTHNFTFFRQVRNWFHHLKGQRKKDISKRPARFYMLNCSYNGVERSTKIDKLDPLLEKYNSEYHFLFARIYQASTSIEGATLEQNYIFPNMARRLLEAFLAFRQPDLSDNLWSKVQSLSFDESKKIRILRFLHTYSHKPEVGSPEHDPSILAETRAVLRDLMDLIKEQDRAHYDAMINLIESST